MTKHRVVARITRKALLEGLGEGAIGKAAQRALNLNVYDTVEAVVPHPPDSDYLITIEYQGEEHTFPRDVVELISRYEVD